MDVHRRFALRFEVGRALLELLRLHHDLLLFLVVAIGFRLVARGLVTGGQHRPQFGKVLLAALRLVEIPLVGRFRAADRRIVLEHERGIARRAAHIAEKRTDRREDGRHDGHAAGHRIF